MARKLTPMSFNSQNSKYTAQRKDRKLKNGQVRDKGTVIRMPVDYSMETMNTRTDSTSVL